MFVLLLVNSFLLFLSDRPHRGTLDLSVVWSLCFLVFSGLSSVVADAHHESTNQVRNGRQSHQLGPSALTWQVWDGQAGEPRTCWSKEGFYGRGQGCRWTW